MQKYQSLSRNEITKRACTLALLTVLALGQTACQTYSANVVNDAEYQYQIQTISQAIQNFDRPVPHSNGPMPLQQARQPVQTVQPCTNPYSCPELFYGR